MNEQKHPESSRVGGDIRSGAASLGITAKTFKIEPERKEKSAKYPSATLIERTSVKQLPILIEILGKIVKESTPPEDEEAKL